jgi:hypothetical protein
MDFSVLKTRVAQETGLDTTTDATILGAWVNAAYKQICGIDNWPWLLKQATIQTVADITTGTVSINAASTSLTFSSGPAVSVANQYMIQFTGVSDDWYIISAHNAASTSATLSVAFNGTSNISGAPYICRKVFYSLPADLDRIVDIRQARTDSKLGAVDIRTFDRYLPDPDATGDPLYYYLTGMTSGGTNTWQIGVYPIPTYVENLQVRYLSIPADMTSTDLPVLPEKFHDTIVYGALYMFGHAYIDDTRIASAKDRFMEAIKAMKQNYNPIPDQMTVIQPWDSRPRRLVGRLMWPPNYPETWR